MTARGRLPRRPAALPRSRRAARFGLPSLAALGLALTGTAFAFVQLRDDAAAEAQRLLDERSRQTAALFASVGQQIDTLITSGGIVAEVTGGDPDAFREAMGERAKRSVLANVALLRLGDRGVEVVAWAGRSEPLLVPTSDAEILGRLRDIAAAGPLRWVDTGVRNDLRVFGAAGASTPGSEFLVYGEVVAPDALSVGTTGGVEPRDLVYAAYIGRESPETLILSNSPELPISGPRAVEESHIGAESVVLVFGAKGRLAAGLAGAAPWLVLGFGLLGAFGLTAVVELSRRRRDDALRLVAHLEQKNAELDRAATERRQLEERLFQSQKMEAVGQLAGGIAHDFNNLLTAISGYAEFLLAELPADEPCRDDAEEIKRAAGRAASLTQQLLAFSRRQVLQPVVLDVNATVAELERLLLRLIGEDVRLVSAVRADPVKLQQVLVNLAVNARDAMPEGGTLTLETGAVELGDVEAASYDDLAPGRYARIRVADTGCGMDERARTQAFEPFFTTKPVGKGTGLGLATVYGVVKQSGGDVTLASEPGRGAVFTILLPQVGDAQAGTPGSSASARSTSSSGYS